jgi:hypothetical protein
MSLARAQIGKSVAVFCHGCGRAIIEHAQAAFGDTAQTLARIPGEGELSSMLPIPSSGLKKDIDLQVVIKGSVYTDDTPASEILPNPIQRHRRLSISNITVDWRPRMR